MRFLRPVAVAAVAVSVVGMLWADRHPSVPLGLTLVGAEQMAMPALPSSPLLSTSWFCPGVPSGLLPAAGGSFTIANTGDDPFDARVTIFPVGGAPVMQAVTVNARSQSVIVPAQVAPSSMAAALIEMTGAIGAVEQTATSPEGLSITPCVLQPSATWYLADGSTRSDANYTLTMFNPSPADAIVDLAFADEQGTRVTKNFEGRVVPARSLVLIDIGQKIQRKERLSVAATVRTGSLVMGRFQVFRGEDGSRRALVAGAASPALSTTWRFAAGQRGEGGEGTLPAKERVVLHNPGATDAQALLTTFPATPLPAPVPNADGTLPSAAPSADTPALPKPILATVPARQSVVVDLDVDGVPAGLFSLAVTSDQPIVVERALDRLQNGRQVGTLQLGSPLSSTEWQMPAGVPEGAKTTLAIVNVTGFAGTVSVTSLTPAGLLPIPGFENYALPAGALVRLDLDPAGASSRAIVVTSTVEVVTERIVRAETGWSSSLGLPVLAG